MPSPVAIVETMELFVGLSITCRILYFYHFSLQVTSTYRHMFLVLVVSFCIIITTTASTGSIFTPLGDVNKIMSETLLGIASISTQFLEKECTWHMTVL